MALPPRIEGLSRRVDRWAPAWAVGFGAVLGVAAARLGIEGIGGVAVVLGLLGISVRWALTGRPRFVGFASGWAKPRLRESDEGSDGRRGGARVDAVEPGSAPLPVERSEGDGARSDAESTSLPRWHAVVLQTTEGPVELGFRALPAGHFIMGSEAIRDAKPVHRVQVEPFSMMDVPVTRAVYAAVMDGGLVTSRSDVPVSRVSWFDAIKFCNRASLLAGLKPTYVLEGQEVHWDANMNGFRLPTEVEWEYAVRAGTTSEYFFGDSERAPQFAWYAHNAKGLMPVRGKQPNPWQLYDMVGNVWEWCWDAYEAGYEHYLIATMTRSTFFKARPDRYRVLRGGSFTDSADRLRSASRDGVRSGFANGFFGFRCALSSRPSIAG